MSLMKCPKCDIEFLEPGEVCQTCIVMKDAKEALPSYKPSILKRWVTHAEYPPGESTDSTMGEETLKYIEKLEAENLNLAKTKKMLKKWSSGTLDYDEFKLYCEETSKLLESIDKGE